MSCPLDKYAFNNFDIYDQDGILDDAIVKQYNSRPWWTCWLIRRWLRFPYENKVKAGKQLKSNLNMAAEAPMRQRRLRLRRERFWIVIIVNHSSKKRGYAILRSSESSSENKRVDPYMLNLWIVMLKSTVM